jgi:dihydrofolate reductase
MEDALRMCKDAEKAFIIGGAQVFAQGFEVATAVSLTLLHRDVEGDVRFPDFSKEEFVEEGRTHHPDGSEPFTVVTYRRR